MSLGTRHCLVEKVPLRANGKLPRRSNRLLFKKDIKIKSSSGCFHFSRGFLCGSARQCFHHSNAWSAPRTIANLELRVYNLSQNGYGDSNAVGYRKLPDGTKNYLCSWLERKMSVESTIGRTRLTILPSDFEFLQWCKEKVGHSLLNRPISQFSLLEPMTSRISGSVLWIGRKV